MSESSTSPGEGQAQRLEAILASLESVLNQPGVSERLRAAPGPEEWNTLQVLGHLIEIVPYWLHHCLTISQAQGEPPAYGRTLDSPERLEGVEHGAHGDLDSLMDEFREEVRKGAATIRGFSAEELQKVGIHNRVGPITVEESINHWILEHGEAHVQQIKSTLGL
jgi:DinB superfamily